MLSAGQLRNNTYFLYKQEPFKVINYKHTHLSRRGADIKVKAKNLKTGHVLSLNFGANERFEEVNLSRKKMQFLYQEKESLYFMDPKTFEQVEVKKSLTGKKFGFLKEGQIAALIFCQEQVLELELPLFVILKIASCDPGVKGNSATTNFKSAIAENGLSLKVPLFLKAGDRVKVDTRTGEYLKKA